MNTEFKKIQLSSETRYILESAGVGGTSTGGGATLAKELGGVQRRIPTRENDHEIEMASKELSSIIRNSRELLDILKDYSEQTGLEAWQQSKITKATDYLTSVLQSIDRIQNNSTPTDNNRSDDSISEGKLDELHDDLKNLSNEEFEKEYGMTKTEAREKFSGKDKPNWIHEGDMPKSDEELENFLDSIKPELDRLYKLAKTSKKAKEEYYTLKAEWDAANSKLYGLDEQGVMEGPSLPSTLKSIITNGEPITQLYGKLKAMAKRWVDNNGNLKGFYRNAAGQSAQWFNNFYFDKLQNDLYALTKQAPKYAPPLISFLKDASEGRDRRINFTEISGSLPPILFKIGERIKDESLMQFARSWKARKDEYESYLSQLESEVGGDDDFDYPGEKPEKSKVPGQQNAQAEQIVNNVLSNLPKNVAGEIRNAIARAPNKIQALHQELTKRNIQGVTEGSLEELDSGQKRELVRTFKNKWQGGSLEQAIQDTINSLYSAHFLNNDQFDDAEEFLYYVADMGQEHNEPPLDHEEDRMGLGLSHDSSKGVAEGSKKTYQPKHVAWVVNHGDGKVSEFKSHEDDAARSKYDSVKHNRGSSIYAIDQHSQSIPMGSLKALRKKQGVAEGSTDDDEYGPKARDAWLKQQAYEKEYNKKKPQVNATDDYEFTYTLGNDQEVQVTYVYNKGEAPRYSGPLASDGREDDVQVISVINPDTGEDVSDMVDMPDIKEKAWYDYLENQQGVENGGSNNDPYIESLAQQLSERIPKNAPPERYIHDFMKAAQTPNAPGHHQFKLKGLSGKARTEKIRQMALSASYGAKNPSKKKK